MISVADLKGALAPISKIGRKTTDIEIRIPEGRSVKLTVRPVYQGEQSSVQRDVLDHFTALEEEGEKATRSEFMVRLRTELTARSIVAVNGEVIPDQVVTGDMWTNPDTGEEVPVTVTRHEVLSDLISGWAVPIINDFWIRYNDFVTECEQEAEQAVKYDIDDIESEIAYCEERLEILKGRLEDKQAAETEKHKKLAEKIEEEQREAVEQAHAAVREAQEAASQQREAAAEPDEESEVEVATTASEPESDPDPIPTPGPETRSGRKRISPQVVTEPEEVPRPSAPEPEPVRQQAPPPEPQPEPGHVGSEAPPMPSVSRPEPPHMAAKRAATRQPFQAPKSAPESLPKEVPGSEIPVYTLDDEVPVLSERNKPQGPARRQRKGPQSVNPNFRPPE